VSDEFAIRSGMQACMDQMRARLDEHKSKLFQLAIEGPGPDQHYEQPLRLWSEHEIHCAILRGPMGALNGYALVPHGHPWWGLDADDEVPAPRVLDEEITAEQAMDDHGVLPIFLAAFSEDGVEKFTRSLGSQVQCHGALTWTGPMAIEGAPWGWWLGFDCNHHQDAVDPAHASEHMAPFNRRLIEEFGCHVWSEDEVAGEVGRLALAIHEARNVD
jgi:hypothetical protein